MPDAEVAGVAQARDGAGRDVADLVGDVVTQARRTADWLASLPLPRLLAEDAAVAAEAFELVVALDAVTRQLAGGVAVAGGPVEVPPPDAEPPRLAPHAVGDQVRVFADQLARAVALYGAAGCPPPADLRALASRCLALRS